MLITKYLIIKKTDYNTKIIEIENEIADASSLVCYATVNAKATEIENKISGTTGLVKTTGYNTKMAENENKVLQSITNYV